MTQSKPKIHIPVSTWTPTIAKVENGYIVSIVTPADDMNITEVYVHETLNEVFNFLRENFNDTK